MNRDFRLAEPLYIGGVEFLSFGFLFMSPWLGSDAVAMGWIALALLRIFCLAGTFYFAPMMPLKEQFSYAAKVVLYGVPFWASSLFFPLRPGQSEQVSRSLYIYLALLAVALLASRFRTCWYPGLVALSTLLWYQRAELSSATVLPALIVLTPIFWRDRRVRSGETVAEGRALLGLAGLGWVICLFFEAAGAPFGMRALSQAVLLWLFMAAVASSVLGEVKSDTEQRYDRREAELSLPSLSLALRWQYSRLLKQKWGPWLVMLPAIVWGESHWYFALVPLLALPGLVGYASSGTVSDTFLPWWSCGQFVVLWALVEGAGSLVPVWLFVAFLLTAAQAKLSPQWAFSGLHPQMGRVQLEPALRRELRVSAPEGFAGSITASMEPSVDFDDSLSSSAPTGFRERLLERLRQADTEEE